MRTFTCPMTVSITAKFKAAKNVENWTPTSAGLTGPYREKNQKSDAQRILLMCARVSHTVSNYEGYVVRHAILQWDCYGESCSHHAMTLLWICQQGFCAWCTSELLFVLWRRRIHKTKI